MNRKKFLVIGLLGLFVISMFAGVVSAETIWERITSTGGFDISDAAEGLISKWLLIALVILLVYAIASELPFLKGEGKDLARWGVSIIIGILSFLFVPAADVAVILTSYEALGVALTSIIPLVILLVFSWELKKSHPEVSRIIDKPLLILFSVYLAYRWLNLPEESALGYIYIITVGISLLWAFGMGAWAFKKWMGAKRKEKKAAATSTLNKSVDYSKMTAAAFDKLSEEEQDAYKSGVKI